MLKVVTRAERPNYKLPKPSNINIISFPIIWKWNMVLSCFLIGTELFINLIMFHMFLCHQKQTCFLFFSGRIWLVSYFSCNVAYVSYKLFLINHTACTCRVEYRRINLIYQFISERPSCKLRHVPRCLDARLRPFLPLFFHASFPGCSENRNPQCAVFCAEWGPW